MHAAGKWVASVVVGGIVLGALLGAAADPRIKDPPKQWWQLTGRDTIASVGEQPGFEAGPVGPGPSDGFRPDFDYDAEAWALPIPAADMAAYYSPRRPFAEAAEPEPTVEATAHEAESVAAEAVDVATAELQATEVVEPELIADGLY